MLRVGDDGAVYSGWLTKRAGSKDDWRVRWFHLKELSNSRNPSYSLAYYKNKKKRGGKQVPKGAISLTWDSEVIPQADVPGHKNVFTVQGQDQGRSYLISAKSRANMVTWINMIQQCIERVADAEGKEPKARGLFSLPDDGSVKSDRPRSPRSPRDKSPRNSAAKKSPRQRGITSGSIGRRKGSRMSPRRRPSSAMSPRKGKSNVAVSIPNDQPFPGINVRSEAFPGVPIRSSFPTHSSSPTLNLDVVRENSLMPDEDWRVLDSDEDGTNASSVDEAKDDVYNQPFNFSAEEGDDEGSAAVPVEEELGGSLTAAPGKIDLTLNLNTKLPRKPLPPPPPDDDEVEPGTGEMGSPLLEFLTMYGIGDLFERLTVQDIDLETLMMFDVADLRRLNLGDGEQAKVLCEALDLSFDGYKSHMRRSTAPGTKLRNLLMSIQAGEYFEQMFLLIDYRSLTLMGEDNIRQFDLPDDVLERLVVKIRELQMSQ